jgi:hypothetical protein
VKTSSSIEAVISTAPSRSWPPSGRSSTGRGSTLSAATSAMTATGTGISSV